MGNCGDSDKKQSEAEADEALKKKLREGTAPQSQLVSAAAPELDTKQAQAKASHQQHDEDLHDQPVLDMDLIVGPRSTHPGRLFLGARSSPCSCRLIPLYAAGSLGAAEDEAGMREHGVTRILSLVPRMEVISSCLDIETTAVQRSGQGLVRSATVRAGASTAVQRLGFVGLIPQCNG